MTSKNWFFNGMTEEIKRRLWAVALSSLTFFFTFPVAMVYLMTEKDLSMEENRVYFIRNAMALLSYDNDWTVFLMSVTAVVLGFSGFSYLNSRAKVDFYHSLPMRREKQFLIRYLCGVFIAAVPYLLFSLISAQIAGAAGAPLGTAVKTALYGWAYHMLSFLIPYTTAVIAAMLTGNIVVGLLGFAVLNVYIPVFLTLCQGLAETCLETFCNHQLAADWAGRTSPMFYYIEGFKGTVTGGMILSRLATAAVFILIAAVLHKKRPSEAAGRAMAFPVSQPLFGILITTEVAVAGLMFFWALGGMAPGWAVFGLLAGGVICHCIIQIIYGFDFKKLFCHKRQMLLSMVLAFGMFAVFFWDLTGYDSWLPGEGKLMSAAAYTRNEVDGWVDYGTLKEGTDEYRGRWNWIDDQTYIDAHMELANTELATGLAQEWIGNWNRSGMNAVRGTDRAEEMIYVSYRLKSGKTVRRGYRIPYEEAEQAFAAIYQDAGYREGRYPVQEMIGDQLKGVQVSLPEKQQLFSEAEGISLEDMAEILEAYQSDLRSLTLEQSMELPVGEIRFLDEVRLKAVNEMEPGNWVYGDWEFYPLYPDCRQTLAILEEYGILPAEKVPLEKISAIWVEAHLEWEEDPIREDVYTYEGYEERDREAIERITAEMQYSPYREFCSFSGQKEEVSLSVNFTDGGSRPYYLPAGDTAEWLKERIKEKNGLLQKQS